MQTNYVIRRYSGPAYYAGHLATASSIASDMVEQARRDGVHCFPIEIIRDRDGAVMRSYPPDREPTPAESALAEERESAIQEAELTRALERWS